MPVRAVLCAPRQGGRQRGRDGRLEGKKAHDRQKNR